MRYFFNVFFFVVVLLLVILCVVQIQGKVICVFDGDIIEVKILFVKIVVYEVLI